MKDIKSLLIYGFAIFAMFFGSGNLVFPLEIGHFSGEQWLIGFMGLFITGILLPFLGIFVVKLHNGDCNAFFAEGGGFAKIVLPFLILSVLGGFGVVPRCITVAHAGINYITEIPLGWFSVFFCLLVFLISSEKESMINIIGKWMSPILIFILISLIFIGVLGNHDIFELKVSPLVAFKKGFITGYQTMDLFAAFFFSSLVFFHISSYLPSFSTPKDVIKVSMKPTAIAAIILSIVYLGLVFLGSRYSNIITLFSSENMLIRLAEHMIGVWGTILVALAIFLSCITTAVVLASMHARYISSIIKFDDIPFKYSLLGVLVISFMVSFNRFDGIVKMLSPFLSLIYPGIIYLTIMCLIFPQGRAAKFKVYGLYTVLIGYVLIRKYT